MDNACLPSNSMLLFRPDLYDQWDFTKNDALGLDVYKITKGSGKKAWWICPKCSSGYDAVVFERVRGSNCPYCKGFKVNSTNSLAKLNPKLASEWHPSLNEKLTPHEVTCYKGIKVWWLGKCGHEWEARIDSRSGGSGCPICDNKKVQIGYNDMWTTNPILASKLLNLEDGFKLTQFSDQKVNWKCPDCEGVINKTVKHANIEGIKCTYCSDGFSMPEKIMHVLLKQLDINFKFDTALSWSKGKRYDFYIPSLSLIIEMHGGQHTGRGFENIGGRTLEEEQENDKYKKKIAIENGINDYIEINCDSSDLNYIKESISSSGISKLIKLDDIDWLEIATKSQNSISKEACDLWNNGNKSRKLISELLSIHERTVIRYLTFWSNINKCDYTEYNNPKRSIVQLTPDGELVKKWTSISEAIKNNKVSLKSENISKACQGKRNHVGGFKWMYLEDYEEFVSTGTPPYPLSKPHPNSKSVVKLNKDLELLKAYETTQEAIKDNNIRFPSAISNVCRGKKKTAGGFVWMYVEDYNNMKKNN